MDDHSSVCLKFMPGVVLALEDHDVPPYDYPIYGLSEAAIAVFSPMAGIVLRAYFVAPGDELRYLLELGRRPGTIVTSLNYLGRGSSAAPSPSSLAAFAQSPPVYWEAVVCQEGRSQRANSREITYELGRPKLPTISELGVARPQQNPVVVVDFEWKHYKEMRDKVSEEFTRYQNDSFIFGIYTEKDPSSYLTLWDCLRMLMAICELTFRVAAVNLSFDLGVVCEGPRPAPAPLCDCVRSFPMVEEVLDRLFRVTILEESLDPPLIFAAAGNRKTKREPIWRLAYPASLPDVVAVTDVDVIQHKTDVDAIQHEFVPSPWADLVAMQPMKPCVARTPRGRREGVGTSYACAAMAGRYSALDGALGLRPEHRLGNLAKLALLLRHCELPLHLNGEKAKLSFRPWVIPDVLPFDRGTDYLRGIAKFDDLKFNEFELNLRDLNRAGRAGGRQYLLTGSASFLIRWLEYHDLIVANPPDDPAMRLRNRLQGLVHDLDIIYAGPFLSDKETRELRRQIASGPLGTVLLGDSSGEEAIQFLDLRKWTSNLQLLQCVIPSACNILTECGLIHPWDFSSDLVDGLRLFVPPKDAWAMNPQFLCESAGLVHGFLIWLNLNLLAARLSQEFEPELKARLTRSTLVVRPEIQSLIHRFDINDTEVKLPPAHANRPSAKNRIARRIERSKALKADLNDAAFPDDLRSCYEVVLKHAEDLQKMYS
jgi:hypothetical protein